MQIKTFTPAAVLLLAASAHAAVADFEDLTLGSQPFYNGADQAGGFESRGAQFSNSFDTQFGSWNGFAYSQVSDSTTPGFGNQYAAITGAGFGGNGIYGLGFDPGSFGSRPQIAFPQTGVVQGMYVTNTTWAYLSIRDGNDGFGAVRQFGDDPNQPGGGNQGFADWFKLIVTGLDDTGQTTGTVEFFLADYRFADSADDYVLDDWTWMDLSALGEVRTLRFAMDSSDVGSFGINTPTFFAMDNLTFVPEPSIAGAAGLATLLCAARRRRRSK